MKLVLQGYKVDDNISYKILEHKRCCEELVNCGFVDLGEDYHTEESPEVCVIVHRHENSWGDDFDWDEPRKILFCPFCGEKIEIEFDSMQDMTEQYYTIQHEVNSLIDNANSSDSKKEENELRRQARELSDKLNLILMNESIMEKEVDELPTKK